MSDETHPTPPAPSASGACCPASGRSRSVTRDGAEVGSASSASPGRRRPGGCGPTSASRRAAERGRVATGAAAAALRRFGGLPRGRQRAQEDDPRRRAPARARRRAVGGRGREAARTPSPARAAADRDDRSPTLLSAFNHSDHRRTVAGLTRTLGPPRATGLLRDRATATAPRVRLTIAWEITWYQWEVGPSSGAPRGPRIRQGRHDRPARDGRPGLEPAGRRRRHAGGEDVGDHRRSRKGEAHGPRRRRLAGQPRPGRDRRRAERRERRDDRQCRRA